ncbi:hypothetical protein CVT25_014011 [Psilocybe cyanescens]|uniref:Dol-P-Glc:Glc(2)Man(9)GlcNAc(2)-PP-Dol alpha-1,2-glucosyltransferase n=1 Tax=Psilocybe cyanescens TaxID=93625 RepID=A0A409XPQ8_PSICY|nr:hypothetical protein CVT25_014011 [Psilocybe cyanescens]
MSSLYAVFCTICVTVLKEMNTIVDEPYMDEPFHIPQAQAYCRGEFSSWDSKITTPPGLYFVSVFLKRLFLVKCNLAMLRLTPLLTLMALPLALTRLISYYKRERPPASILSPLPEAIVLAAFPIAWFFGFLYYTEVPSLLLVVCTVVAAFENRHWLAALLGLVSCTFRQTNIVWVLYAYASSQLMHLRFRRPIPGKPPLAKLHDPPALAAGPGDLLQAIVSAPKVLSDILFAFIPYTLVLAVFGAFVVWNEGIVLGDKSNHIPSFHIPQLYYFVASATFFGWPVLVSGPGGAGTLIASVRVRMFDSKIPKSKPATRNSIRQSLNLASVGKAFADAISKDGREASKNAKKTKEASRRNSVLSSLPSAPRASMGDVRPSSQSSKRTSTPDSKTASRRRVSTSHQRDSPDEKSPKPSESATPQPISAITRTSTLRPRNANGTSALPKYRPKSVLVEISKPPSPTRAGTRRRFSTSDDEKKEQTRPTPSISPVEKTLRPISPLPQRAALKTNLTNSVNATPPTTPSKPKLTTPTSAKTSSSRPAKIVKTTPAITTIPRPPSSSSSSLLAAPATTAAITPKSSIPKGSPPKSSGLKTKLGLSRSVQDKSKSSGGQSTIHHLPSRDSPSPLAQRARKTLKAPTPASSSLSGQSANMSHISEGNSEDEDSDAEDVALLLAPVAAISAPTPAMPRIQLNRKRLAPQTPTRANLPSRGNMSYSSPLPPDTAEKSLLLRPPQRESANQRAMRGSILSWEQLANEQSVSLGEDEFGRMLSEIPAPFRSGAVSPSLSSHIDVPESPCLSAIDSPGGYGSISQVLLPEVTPSPAMHQSLLQGRFSLSPDKAAMDASTCTLLRLQLASVENTAKERLFQIQAIEEEFHHVQQAHTLQMEEMQKQMHYMETQWRTNEEQNPSVAFLEEQILLVQRSRDEAVAEAVARCQEEARLSSSFAIKAEQLRQEALSSARLASSGWETFHEACDMELSLLQGDRTLLSVLLAQLDQMCYAL